MLALTVTQPWASLIAHGHKRVETRSWGADKADVRRAVGQHVAIHAGKGVDGLRDLYEDRPPADEALDRLCYSEPFLDLLVASGIGGTTALPRGAIVAVAVLDRVTQMSEESIAQLAEKNPQEYALGFYEPGRWAWVLRDVQRLAEPRPDRGRQGLWTTHQT